MIYSPFADQTGPKHDGRVFTYLLSELADVQSLRVFGRCQARRSPQTSKSVSADWKVNLSLFQLYLILGTMHRTFAEQVWTGGKQVLGGLCE